MGVTKRASHMCMLASRKSLESQIYAYSCEKKSKEKFTLFSDHNGSLLRRQPGAMTIGHSPKGKENS